MGSYTKACLLSRCNGFGDDFNSKCTELLARDLESERYRSEPLFLKRVIVSKVHLNLEHISRSVFLQLLLTKSDPEHSLLAEQLL